MLFEIETLAFDDQKIPGIINIENLAEYLISGGLV